MRYNRFSMVSVFIFYTLSIFLLTALLSPALAQDTGSAYRYKEDVDGNGEVEISDVLALLRLGRENPSDARADYNGDGSFNVVDAIALLICIVNGNLHPVEPAASQWRVLGPGGGGAMFIPSVDPFDPGHVLLACDMTGAYVTFDDGASWRMFNLRTRVADFEFDPTSEGTVYAANTGLWRSEDGGTGWNLVYPAPADVIAEHMVGDHAEQWFETGKGRVPETWIDKIRVDPADGNHLYIGLGRWWNGPAKVMVSDDRGANWRILSGVPGDNVIAIFPGNWWNTPDEVTVVTNEAIVRISQTTGDTMHLELPDTPVLDSDGGKGSEGAIIYLLTELRQAGSDFVGGPYRSTDGGATWVSINSSLTDPTEVPAYNLIAACQNQPEMAYLSCESFPVNRQGIFKTTDSGDTWNWVFCEDWSSIITKNFTDSWHTRNYGHGYSGRPHGLGVCPTDPDVCFASSGRSYRTIDGGATWQTVYSNDMGNGAYSSRGLDVTTCYGVHFDPFDSLHVFITYTDIGLFQSYDGGESWVHAINGITGSVRNTCYWLEFDPEVEGQVWSVWSNWHDLPRMKMFNENWPDARGIPAVSTDGGRTWRATSFGAPGNAPHTHILVDPQSPVDNRTLYVCAFGQGVYKSVNSGGKWEEASAGLGDNRSVWRITRTPEGTLFLVVVRNGTERDVIPGALYRSDNGAASWEQVPLPGGVSGPNDLAVDPSNSQIMYLSCWPWTDRSVEPRRERSGGLYRTYDSGTTWEQVFREDSHVYAAAVDPDSPATVIINTFDSAAFRSDNRGESWYRLIGYNFKWGHRPIFDPHHTGMIYLTSFGGSVFYGPATGLPGESENFENWPEQWRWGE